MEGQVEDLNALQAQTGITFSKGPQTFTRTKKKTQDDEHIVSEAPEVHLGAKPSDPTHRTVTDASKNTEEVKEHHPRQDKRGPKPPREPKLDADGNPIPFERKQREPKLDADGNPIPYERKQREPKLDAEGNPIPYEKKQHKPKYDEEGNVIPFERKPREPRLDADGKPIPYEKK